MFIAMMEKSFLDLTLAQIISGVWTNGGNLNSISGTGFLLTHFTRQIVKEIKIKPLTLHICLPYFQH